MLEPIVSSRIRRTLVEYLLAHPHDRVYLRGLAKQLTLSISPLRRELKRLEELGVLNAYDEANIRFYVVNPSSTFFSQLTAISAEAPWQPTQPKVITVTPPQPVPVAVEAVPSSKTIKPASQAASPSWQAIVGGAGLSLLVAAVLGGVAYLAYTNQRLLMTSHPAVANTKPKITTSGSSAHMAVGSMRSARWTLIPGGAGAGFSTARKESY